MIERRVVFIISKRIFVREIESAGTAPSRPKAEDRRATATNPSLTIGYLRHLPQVMGMIETKHRIFRTFS